jgi:pilus assembly protein CpaE
MSQEMTDQCSVVIIDPDENSRRFIKTMLGDIPWVKSSIEAVDFTRGHEQVKQHQPTIVILNISSASEQALKLAEKISQTLPRTTLFVTSTDAKPELIIKAMRAGAREFLPMPLSKEDFHRALKTVRWKSQWTSGGAPGNKIVTVFGVKGGVGTTTIATNLAINLAERAPDDVVLVDLNLQLGTVALFLNLQSAYTIIDILNHLDDLAPSILRDALAKHSSGVHLLTGPARLEDADVIRGSHIDQILTLLRSTFRYIVIDANDVLDEVTLKVLDESDSILTVFTSDLPAIYNTHQCLDIFQRMGYGREKVLLIMNRCASLKGAPVRELEESIDYPIFWKIPNQDYATVVSSINQGIPISTMKPKSQLSRSFHEMVLRLNGNEDAGGQGKENHMGYMVKRLVSRFKGSR